MHSDAATVEEYLSEFSDERRETVKEVRKVILENLPEGYEEVMNWGMICYQAPLEIYPDTYNGKALMYAALASQKNHMAVYLTGIYMDEMTVATLKKASVRAESDTMSGNHVYVSESWMTCRSH